MVLIDGKLKDESEDKDFINIDEDFIEDDEVVFDDREITDET